MCCEEVACKQAQKHIWGGAEVMLSAMRNMPQLLWQRTAFCADRRQNLYATIYIRQECDLSSHSTGTVLLMPGIMS